MPPAPEAGISTRRRRTGRGSKVPGTVDMFNRPRTVVELDASTPWTFAELRGAVPLTAVRPRSWHYDRQEATQ